MQQQKSQPSEDFSRILNAVHCGQLHIIKAFHTTHPHVHFTTIRYKMAGDTILHISARLGHVDIVEYLLANYEPNSADFMSSDHKTALHEAAQFARWRCGLVLIQYGADVNALKKADWTPLMLACTKTKANEEDSHKMVELLAANGALVNYKNKDGWTAAHLLAREGNLDIFNLLRNQYNLDISLRTNNGRTIFHIAALHGHLQFLVVINTSNILHIRSDTLDQCGNTALHEACLGGHVDVVRFLISTGSNYRCLNSAGFGCLHLAAGAGHCNVVRCLLEDRRFDVNTATTNGCLTALHLAARKKFENVCELLLTFGAREDVKDSMGRTAMDYRKMKT